MPSQNSKNNAKGAKISALFLLGGAQIVYAKKKRQMLSSNPKKLFPKFGYLRKKSQKNANEKDAKV